MVDVCYTAIVTSLFLMTSYVMSSSYCDRGGKYQQLINVAVQGKELIIHTLTGIRQECVDPVLLQNSVVTLGSLIRHLYTGCPLQKSGNSGV